MQQAKNRFSSLVLVAVVLITFCGFFVIAVVHDGLSASAKFVLLLTGLAACVIEYASWHEFFPNGRVCRKGAKRLGGVILGALIGGLLLELGTEFGAAVSTLGCFSFKRYVLFVCLSYLVFFLATKFHWGAKVKAWAFGKRKSLSSRKVLVALSVVIGMLALSGAVVALLPATEWLGVGKVRAYSLAVAAIGSLALVVCSVLKPEIKIENVFLGISLLFGMCLIVSEPAMPLESWDDEIHYERSLLVSYGLWSETTEADLQMMRISPDTLEYVNTTEMTESELAEYSRSLDLLYRAGEDGLSTEYTTDSAYALEMWGVAYIPAAIGLWIGRLLHLPFALVFGLGRLGNLLFYCLMGFFAIRTIPVKKTFLCVALLIPTLIFLASNYSYDYWIVCLVALFVALLAKVARTDDGSVEFKNCIPMLLALFFALCPKAIYFPLFALLLLMPKSRFKTKSDRRLFYAIAIALALILIASFIIPFVFSGGGGSGDARGGSEVNSSAQVAFVLSNPSWYAGVLGNFLVGTYLNLFGAGGFLVNFAYFGILSISSPIPGFIYAVALLGLALLSRPVFCVRKRQVCSLVLSVLVGIVTAALIASALYVSYTAVGLDTVSGCQHRYLLPLVVCLGVTMFGINAKLGKLAPRFLVSACLVGAILALFACVLRLVVM